MQKKIPIRTRAAVIGIHSAERRAALALWAAALLALGLLTPLCSLALVIVMIVAIATNRIQSIQASGVLAWLDDFLYLPEVLYVIILVWLIFSGPGRYSIDGLISRPAGGAGR